MSRNQLNVRVTSDIEAIIDAKRIELAKSHGSIPTRSDVVRFALEAYLGVSFDSAAELVKAPKPGKRANARR